MTARHYLTVSQTAEDLDFAEDTIRIWCAQSRRVREEGRPEAQILPGAAKATDSPQSHWRIPESAVRDFGTQRAVSRTTSLDHKRRQELMAAHRAAA